MDTVVVPDDEVVPPEGILAQPVDSAGESNTKEITGDESMVKLHFTKEVTQVV